MISNLKKKIFIAGHKGMVGSSILRKIQHKKNIQILVRDRNELDLTNQKSVNNFFLQNKPDEVYISAAKVGGILANKSFPADFIYSNLAIQINIIHAAFNAGVKKVLFLGSSCIYPKFAKQPITEDQLMTGFLEKTNEPYAIAKIAGIKLCESYNNQFGESHSLDFRCLMPTNLYGPGDNYHKTNSHVIPALIRRIHEAKINKSPSVEIWGTGLVRREFLFVDDLSDACIYFMNLEKKLLLKYITKNSIHINIGTGKDCTIKELASLISKVIGYEGQLRFDKTKPDGTPRKLLDVSKAKKMKWEAKISLIDGLKITYKDFKKNFNN